MNGLNLYAQIEQDLGIEDELVALRNTFKEVIEQLNLDSLLDIGCGQGAFLESLKESNIGTTFGIDLSSLQIEIASTKDINVKCTDISKVSE